GCETTGPAGALCGRWRRDADYRATAAFVMSAACLSFGRPALFSARRERGARPASLTTARGSLEVLRQFVCPVRGGVFGKNAGAGSTANGIALRRVGVVKQGDTVGRIVRHEDLAAGPEKSF